MDGCGTTPGMEEVERRPEQPSRTASGTSGREAAPAHPATAPALLYLRHPCRRPPIALRAIGCADVRFGILPPQSRPVP